MRPTADNKDTFYNTLINLMKHRQSDTQIPEKDKSKFCFMLHDERANEIQKIEVDDLFEWLNDGSLEKTDKLYISFLVKEY